MMPLDSLLTGMNLLFGALNALLLLRVLHTLARRDQAVGGTAQRRRQFRHAYAGWLLGQMRAPWMSPPRADPMATTVIDLGEARSWPRRYGDDRYA